MYRYDEYDHQFVRERVDQFRGQVARRLAGELTEEEFKPLRLMNGLYLQLHAYMLRVAIPYGLLSSDQLRKLADIARRYDRGYGHFTTRQNIQFNWPKLEDVPNILSELAEVEMHAIQTSGNCIRNTTADPYAGVVAGEVADPRIYSELIRQWSSLHPEFTFLPRKFKIAVTGSDKDRAAIRYHDIGLKIVKNADGVTGFQVFVGGGMGRTPMLAKVARDFLPADQLLRYLDAILRVYNLHGRRDNKYKARIKILVHEVGIEKLKEQFEDAFEATPDEQDFLVDKELARIARHFAGPDYEQSPVNSERFEHHLQDNPGFANWARTNLAKHKAPGYAIVTLSLKPRGGIPGDVTAEQMDAVADLADKYSFGQLRATHTQNLVFADVRLDQLYELWGELERLGLAEANVEQLGDIIACPGLDYCSLANARSIPVAQEISKRFGDPELQKDIGPLAVKISGCINACGHHHAGHIGILGVDRKGVEAYQITLGGSADEDAAIGKIIGPSFAREEVADVIETILETYRAHRNDGETFLETYRRIGAHPFKETIYDAN